MTYDFEFLADANCVATNSVYDIGCKRNVRLRLHSYVAIFCSFIIRILAEESRRHKFNQRQSV